MLVVRVASWFAHIISLSQLAEESQWCLWTYAGLGYSAQSSIEYNTQRNTVIKPGRTTHVQYLSINTI